MCARLTFTLPDAAALARLLGLAQPSAALLAAHHPRFNVCPSQSHLLVLPGPTLVLARWSLGEHHQANVRAESLQQHRSWHPCLVPADGFYEWDGPAHDRRPWWFCLPERAPFLMGGVTTPSGDAFAIITVPAVDAVAAIHDRMPLCVTLEHARPWLAHPNLEARAALPLVGVPVSKRVNSPHVDDAECLARREPAPQQLRLL